MSEKIQTQEKEDSNPPGNDSVASNNETDEDDHANPNEKSFDESDDFDDTESLLRNSRLSSGNSSSERNENITSLDIDDGNDENNDPVHSAAILRKESCCCGAMQSTQSVGNMRIFFPDYFYSSGWGVVGPHTFGPIVVWMLLLSATHGILNGINKHNLGLVSEIITYLFLGVCTYRLTDVSYRDPGICLDQEIPGHETPERASQYRYCDRCKVWQPPDGVHCPKCNVCVAGYDHHCVWMGTCIGKRNYRQFVKFNMTWLLYAMYGFFWVLTFGPLIMKKVPSI